MTRQVCPRVADCFASFVRVAHLRCASLHSFMRAFVILLLFSLAAFADTKLSNSSPGTFDTVAAMDEWAQSAFGGAIKEERTYKEHQLVVYFRSYTSGVATSEPYVFFKKDGKWICLLSTMMCRCEMTATIDGDFLILWRLDYPEGKAPSLKSPGEPIKTEYLRLNLKSLNAS